MKKIKGILTTPENIPPLSPETQTSLRQLRLFVFWFGAFDIVVWFIVLASGHREALPYSFILSLIIFSGMHQGKANELYGLMLIATLGLLGQNTIALTNFLAPLELTYLRLRVQPLYFIWYELGLSLTAYFSIILFLVCKSNIASDVVRCLPEYKHAIGKDWQLSSHLPMLYAAFGVVLFSFLPVVSDTLSGKYHAQALALAKTANAGNDASEHQRAQYYVEWVSAGYGRMSVGHNSTDRSFRVHGRVSVYDGQKLKSVRVTWLEKQ